MPTFSVELTPAQYAAAMTSSAEGQSIEQFLAELPIESRRREQNYADEKAALFLHNSLRDRALLFQARVLLHVFDWDPEVGNAVIQQAMAVEAKSDKQAEMMQATASGFIELATTTFEDGTLTPSIMMAMQRISSEVKGEWEPKDAE